MYICLEGIDCSGKSTQILLLEKWIKKYVNEVIRVHEPTDSDIGKMIRQYLKNNPIISDNFQTVMALLFAADRVNLVKKVDEVKKNKGIIITDRSLYSSIVYQNGPKWIREINKYAKKPDIVILLDLDIDIALKRRKSKDTFENKPFLEKVRQKYIKLAENPNFYIVDGNNTIKTIHEKIKRILIHEVIHYISKHGSNI